MIGNRSLVAWGWGIGGMGRVITKGYEETSVGDPSVHYLYCGGGFRTALIC